jgi:CBS domain-containing protein
MKARDVMTPNPDVVTPDEPITRAAQVMRDRDVGIVPVVEDRATMKLRGVITTSTRPASCRGHRQLRRTSRPRRIRTP